MHYEYALWSMGAHLRLATVQLAAERWPALLRQLPAPKELSGLLSARWRTLALTAGTADPFT